MERKVVVTGMGIWSCLGTDLDTVKQSLYEGKSGIGIQPERLTYGYRSALTGIVAEPVITFFFSAKYAEVAPVLIWFIINSIIAGLAWILSQNMLLQGRQILLFTRQFISILVFVVLFYLLKEYQLYGMAYAYLGASLTRLVISIIYFYKYPIENIARNE